MNNIWNSQILLLSLYNLKDKNSQVAELSDAKGGRPYVDHSEDYYKETYKQD
jgi:hypothetical protein